MEGVILKVFVSYSLKDMAWVAGLGDWLRSIGDVEVFVSEYETPAGAVLVDEIKGKIDWCDVFLVLLSSNSARSEWVQQEIGYAIACHKYVIPLTVEPGALPQGMIKGIRAVDLSKDSEVASLQLYQALESLKVQEANRRALLILGGIILGLATAIMVGKDSENS